MSKQAMRLGVAAAVLSGAFAFPAAAVASPAEAAAPGQAQTVEQSQSRADVHAAGWKLYDKYFTKGQCSGAGKGLVQAPNKIDKYKCVEGQNPFQRWVLYIHT